MSRKLVITADDLGRDAATNVEIESLGTDGLITATTLITVSEHSADAARRFVGAPIMPHLHVVLTSDGGLAPWHPLSTNSDSLVDADGASSGDPFVLGARGETDQVIAEADVQLAWMRSHGLQPRVADSHTGTLYGLHGRSWLAAALRWCADNDLDFRLPRDPAPYMGGPLPAPLAEAHASAVALADDLGVRIPATIMTNRRAATELGSYERLRDDYVARLDALPDGASELFMQPSRESAVAGPAGALHAEIVRVWEARLLRGCRMWRRAAASSASIIRWTANGPGSMRWPRCPPRSSSGTSAGIGISLPRRHGHCGPDGGRTRYCWAAAIITTRRSAIRLARP